MCAVRTMLGGAASESVRSSAADGTESACTAMPRVASSSCEPGNLDESEERRRAPQDAANSRARGRVITSMNITSVHNVTSH